MAIRKTEFRGVYTDGAWFLTRNLVQGATVYGEALVWEGGAEYRRWDATRSKLAAYLKKGGRRWPFQEDSRVLYLGAGSGTTASHLSDICAKGSLLAIEISPRVFRDLVSVAERRPNLLPILGDADRPASYRQHLPAVDVLYQDVAQRDQERIFLKNAEFLRASGTGILMVKARSVDVAANPAEVYGHARGVLEYAGLKVVDVRPLDPLESDHAAIVVEKPPA